MTITLPVDERRRARAQDPDTGINELLNAAFYYPREVLRNPGLTLELVVNPDLARTMPQQQLAALVRFPEAPDLLIQQAIERAQANYMTELCSALLANPRLTREQAEAVVGNRGDLSLPDRLIENHALLGDSFDERPPLDILLQAFLARRPASSERFQGTGLENRVLTEAVYQREEWRRWAAGAPVTPPDLLAQIGQDKHGSTISALIENPSTPAETLAEFYQRYQDRPATLQSLASHANLPAAVRAEMLEREPLGALTGLAENPSLTPDEQMAIATRDNSATRQFLCQNRNLTTEVQVYLAREGNPEVHRQLLRRRWLAPEALEVLKRSSDRIVALSARSHTRDNTTGGEGQHPLSALIDQLRIQGSNSTHTLLAGTSHNAPALLLDMLAAFGKPLERLAAAIHPNTSPETRELLAVDPDRRVAKAAQEPPCRLK